MILMKTNYKMTIIFIITILFIGYLLRTISHILNYTDVIKSIIFNLSDKAFDISFILDIYWLLLPITDAIIAFLLINRFKIGAALAFINILINVIINIGLKIITLSVVSLNSIYDVAGNVYDGLNIALLIFSMITLPLIISHNQKYIGFFLRLPFYILIIGLVIHLKGLIQLTYHFESIWVLWVHVSMTIIDGALFYLLLYKVKSGYILGMILFQSFGMLQIGFAVVIIFGANCSFNLSMAITIALCYLASTSLILNKDKLSTTSTCRGYV